jgi:hypothetical protein
MPEATIALDASAHELARRGVMETAVKDLRNLAEMLDELSGATWPMPGTLVADARGTVGLVRESLAAVDALGWPDTDAEAT